MKKHDPLWHDINNLLSDIWNYDVLKKVRLYYLNYGNSAPGDNLEAHIDKLQKRLDEAEE